MLGKGTARLSPEHRLIISLSRIALGLETQAEGETGNQDSWDWDLVCTAASREGLAPLVYAALQSTKLPVPDPIRATLRMGYLAAVTRTEACLEPTLRRLLPGLESLGLKPIVLKGAALAYTAYADPVYRTMADIDLLLPCDQMARAEDALRELGFSTDGDAPEPGHHHLRPRYSAEWPLGVEIHHHLLPESNRYQIDPDGYWTRCQTAEVAGVEARVLAPEDALHFACVHLAYAHRYRWFPLRSLIDVLAITTSANLDLDWSLFVAITRLSRTAGAVYWPLLLSRDWLGAPVPERALSALAPPPMVGRLVAAVADPSSIIDREASREKGADVLYDLLLNLSLYQGCSRADQARAVLRSLFPPPELVGHLPAEFTRQRLRYAAYLARPGRVGRGVVAFGRLLARTPVR